MLKMPKLLGGDGSFMEELCLNEYLDKNQILSNIKKYRILSTLPYEKINFWTENITILSRKDNKFFKHPKLTSLNELIFISKLVLAVLKKDYDLIMLTGGERGDLVYLLLITFCFWKETPHIIVTAEWTVRRSRFRSLIQKLYFKFTDRLVKQVQPLSKEEVDIYHENFGIPKSKFKVIPFSTTVIGYDFIPQKGDFVLTGGISFRDYSTFLHAVQNLNLPIEIGIPLGRTIPIEKINGNQNIKILNLSRREFMNKTANCKIFAVPILPALGRSVADQSILNAMYFGKIVVATNSIGPRIYIQNGINGFLIPESNSSAWIEILNHVYSLEEKEYAKIAANAEYTAKQIFSEEK